jgi:hypothetical protein
LTDHSPLKAHQFPDIGSHTIGINSAIAKVDAQVAAFVPSQLAQLLDEGCHIGLAIRLSRRVVHEHANPPHAVALLRLRRE